MSDNLKSLKHSSNINKKEFNKIDDDIKNSLIEYIQHSKIPRNNRLKDRISMAHSVELRLPFLEHDLLEFALSLNTKSYFLNGKSKSVLRYAAKDYIDPRVRFKKKLSLQSPQNSWLKDGKIKEYINDIFHSKKFIERGIFDAPLVHREWNKFLQGGFDTSFFIWQILSTEIWFNVFIDKNIDQVNKKYKFE